MRTCPHPDDHWLIGAGVFDFDNPWFRPLWRRVLTCAVALAWGGFELYTGSPGWAILFLAVGGYAGWRFFVTFEPKA